MIALWICLAYLVVGTILTRVQNKRSRANESAWFLGTMTLIWPLWLLTKVLGEVVLALGRLAGGKP